MALGMIKALLCARKLRRALSFFEAPGDLSAFGGTRFNLCSLSGLFKIF